MRLRKAFVGQGLNITEHAGHYISGLMGTQRRKKIETFENDVSGSDYQGMEQFISSLPCSHGNLLDDVAVGAESQATCDSTKIEIRAFTHAPRNFVEGGFKEGHEIVSYR